jgi:hypothetical protein
LLLKGEDGDYRAMIAHVRWSEFQAGAAYATRLAGQQQQPVAWQWRHEEDRTWHDCLDEEEAKWRITLESVIVRGLAPAPFLAATPSVQPATEAVSEEQSVLQKMIALPQFKREVGMLVYQSVEWAANPERVLRNVMDYPKIREWLPIPLCNEADAALSKKGAKP